MIWTLPHETFEKSYIRDFLLPGIEFLELDDCPLPTFADDLIVVAGSGTGLEPRMDGIWSQVSQSCFYVLSDETLNHCDAPYQESRASFRNYPFPGWAGLKGRTVPVGFNGGMVGLKSRSPRKDLAWSFAGVVNKGGRDKMISALKIIEPNLVHPTQIWADPSGVSASDLFDLYSRSHFVPCPDGNVSPDTFRVMEALQAGAIPIVFRFYGFDYFRLVFGNHPFIVVSSWKEAAKVVKRLLADDKELSGLHDKVNDWYNRFLGDLRHDIVALVTGQDFASLKGEQFRYHLTASRNPVLLLVFWFHFRRPVHRSLRAVRRAWNYSLVKTRITRIVRFRQG